MIAAARPIPPRVKKTLCRMVCCKPPCIWPGGCEAQHYVGLVDNMLAALADAGYVIVKVPARERSTLEPQI